mgnify:CR=1 FL=1
MMKNIIEKFQICLVLSALLFSSFVAACSGNDDTVTPEITIPANILTDGMTFSKTGGTSTLNIPAVHRSGVRLLPKVLLRVVF